MDTRKKILNLDEAAEVGAALRARGVRLKLVAGYFDVLTADRVRRLRALADGQPLMAAVLDPPEPLLCSRARAELAAALSAIDYVLPLDGSGLDHALATISPDDVAREEAADRRSAAALMEHVQRRHRE